ncbi:hypothetical protein ACFLU5_05720 [Bacteroidota bacterium]
MYENRLTTHFKILGALLVAYSALQLVGGVILLNVFNIVDIFIDEREVLSVVKIITRSVGIMILLVAIPGMIAGIGLLTDKIWARTFSLIVGIIYLIYIPIGTIIGIYSIWVNSQKPMKEKEPIYATDLVSGQGG